MAEASASGREWSDRVTILVGVVLLALAIWPSGTTADVGAGQEIRYLDAAWALYAFAGLAALAGVMVAQRWSRRNLGRVLIALAGLALLGGLVLFRELGTRAWLTFLLPGVVLLLAARSAGPLPAPD